MELDAKSRVEVLAPIVRGRKGEYRRELADLRKQGFLRARIDGEIVELGSRSQARAHRRITTSMPSSIGW